MTAAQTKQINAIVNNSFFFFSLFTMASGRWCSCKILISSL